MPCENVGSLIIRLPFGYCTPIGLGVLMSIVAQENGQSNKRVGWSVMW